MIIDTTTPGRSSLQELPPRSALSAIARGFGRACPACGTGRLYRAYLKVNDTCASCGEELHHHRADDAPPYFTILLVGHFAIAGVLLLEQAAHPAPWVQVLIWIPLTIALALALLPRIKGALIGLQWANRMHGFGHPDEDALEPIPEPPHSVT